MIFYQYYVRNQNLPDKMILTRIRQWSSIKKRMDPIKFTDASFQEEVMKSPMPVLVDFWAVWCQPCKALGPVIEELAKEYPGKIKVGKMNVDENSEVPGIFGIMSIPTVILFKEGKPVKSFIGVQPKEEYKRAIDALL